MKIQPNPLILLLLLLVSACEGSKKQRILLISGGNPEREEQAWLAFNGEQDWETALLDWSQVSKTDLASYDLIWVHQLDTLAPEGAGQAGEQILQYTEAGGKVLLSMEAMRLLYPWGLEPKPLEVRSDSITDEGFGRPLGFHGFKDHIIYDRMHGGVYPWKSGKDHRIRKTGFFGDQLPGNPDARVLGIEWTYITFHDSTKLVVEYPLGQGKILGVGAYTYFGQDNYNRPELEQFYLNLVGYLSGELSGAAYHWSYEDRQVKEERIAFSDLPEIQFQNWQLPELSIEALSEPAGEDFVSLAGRRLLLMGQEKGGIEEIWNHPFMAARDIRTGISLDGKLRWLSEFSCRLRISPEMLIREYEINGYTLREITTLSFEQPIAVLHYDIPEGLEYEGLVMEAFFNARYMWPYDAAASGSLYWDYSEDQKRLLVAAQEDALVSCLQFSAAPQYRQLGQYGSFNYASPANPAAQATEVAQLGSSFFFSSKEIGGGLELMLGAGSEGSEVLGGTLAGIKGETAGLFQNTHQYYTKLLGEKLRITGPDSVFNEGYAWALARTDQFFQTTPGLGTTQMAGFGTTARGWNGRHEISGRPGYAWYFGRDAEWSGMAVNAYGDFAWVKEMLRVFVRYQALNGKIFHELSTSGAVHYDAADSTPLFVYLASHYLRYSNDLDFIREIWPALMLAMDFCYSTDTDGDGLIENTDVGHGWIEGGALFGVHTEFYLAGSWAAALDGVAYMAKLLGESALVERFAADAEKVKQIIDQDFWSSSGEYFYNGKFADGTYQQEASVLQAVPIYLNTVTDKNKALAALASFGNSGMSTDWGIRMWSADNPRYNPRSYHGGMVWPLYGGWASLAEYKTGYYTNAWAHVRSNLLNYRYWGKGSVEETLHGDLFQPAGVCSQQCWSESMVLQPLIEGMLGVEPDAPHQKLRLSPRFPADWDYALVDNIRMGDFLLDMNWKRELGATTIEITRKDETDGVLTLDLRPTLPLNATVQSVTLDGETLSYTSFSGPESLEIGLKDLNFDKGRKMTIRIEHTAGIRVVAPFYQPKPGTESQGLRIISQKVVGDTFSIETEGRPGNSYNLEVFSSVPLQATSGESIFAEGANKYIIQIEPSGAASSGAYVRMLTTLAPK